MCVDPVTAGLLTAGISMMKTVVGFVAQAQEAKANKENALAANAIEQEQLTLRQIQEQRANQAKLREQNLQEAEVAATLRVAEGSKGVGGLSTESLIADVRRKAARNRDVLSENTRMTVAALQQDKEAATIRAKSRIDSVPPPSALSLVAGIGESALSGYNAYNKYMG